MLMRCDHPKRDIPDFITPTKDRTHRYRVGHPLYEARLLIQCDNAIRSDIYNAVMMSNVG